MTTAEPEWPAGVILQEFIDSEISAEERRQDSLEKRGLALTTVAGTLVTLLLALPSGAGRPKELHASVGATICITVSALAFAGAALCSAWTNAPRMVRLIDPHSFRSVAARYWKGPYDNAARSVFATRIAQLDALQRANDFRGGCLAVGMACLAIAVATLAIASSLLIAGW